MTASDVIFGSVTKNWAAYVAVKTNILNFSYQIIRSFYDKYIARPSTDNSHLLERRNWVKFDQC